MPYGQRVFVATGAGAEGDKFFGEFIYNDTSGSLTNGMPVYVDSTDAAEWNKLLSTTALVPAANATGGNVLLGTNSNANGSALQCVGIYQPVNPNEKPNKGDAIRVLIYGRGIVAAAVKSSGTSMIVGDVLIADNSQVRALSGHNTYTAGKSLGMVLATGGHITVGATIVLATSAAGTQTSLINGFVRLT